MKVRLSFVTLGLLLAVAAYFLTGYLHERRRLALVGLTENACTADGGAVTGRDLDDWAGLCVYRARNTALIAAKAWPEIVMIGDSITMGWPDRDRDRGIVNRGIGRQSSGQILLRFQPDAVALRPRIVHILVGTNDVAGTTGPVTLDQLTDNVRTMVTLAKAARMQVIVGTIPPASDYDFGHRGDPRAAIARVNEMLRILASNERIILVDYHAVLARPDGLPRTDLFADGVHPNPRGYAAIQPLFNRAVAETLRQSQPNPVPDVNGSK